MSSLNLHDSFPLTQSALSLWKQTDVFDLTQIRHTRLLIHKLQKDADDARLSAGELSALGISGRIYLYIINRYIQTVPSAMLEDLDRALASRLGHQTLRQTLQSVLESYPPPHVPNSDPKEFLEKTYNGIKHRYLLYKSILLVMLAGENPACAGYSKVLHDRTLLDNQPFQQLNRQIKAFFHAQPDWGSSGKSLYEFLQDPMLSHPDSIYDQLTYIRKHWREYLDDELIERLSRSLDYIREDHTRAFLNKRHVRPPSYAPGLVDPPGAPSQRFSRDEDWMSNVVLLAKNTYVWLDQLSLTYQKSITRLDQIPESELAKLASWGISGLWLIGIWERSPASQEIKQRCGNPEALPSAYSLYEYRIAAELGGEDAYRTLHHKARSLGIRLAADMVPNHMGILSAWTLKHPDWFLSLEHKPYPNYTFSGPDLSHRDDISIHIEDHYYDRTDAAVVFKYQDHRAGKTRYIYHGNDGTSMPWNDTAQLNFLLEEVREAVIQTILDVADKFSIIRFDAAMTLAKKHYQRLWFPAPGSGGAIPTRAEHGLTKDEFDQRFPKEFWLDVVERIEEERPDTLLIAEAFWMMEGYFVRNLGMHRVYNSAFMHMLRDEKNAQFRELIKKTLDFDRRILKRFVNFMNNPDEETAIAQFGRDGKYFGVCVMLVTLPGTPMFGHGQIEGFREKYGMEYKKAYYDEQPDQALIQRHHREVFPLLSKRWLFSGVKHFVLYDFLIEDGQHVDENVFAYSNRKDDHSALIMYHNAWGDTKGRLGTVPTAGRSDPDLARALGLHDIPHTFVTFRDHISGLEYIRPIGHFLEQELYFKLGAYDYHVFLDFKQTHTENFQGYSDLFDHVGLDGVPSLDAVLMEIRFSAAAQALKPLFSELWKILYDSSPISAIDQKRQRALKDHLSQFFSKLLDPILSAQEREKLEGTSLHSEAWRSIQALGQFQERQEAAQQNMFRTAALIFWAILMPLATLLNPHSLSYSLEHLIPAVIKDNFPADTERERFTLALLIVLKHTRDKLFHLDSPSDTIHAWLRDQHVSQFLHLNEFQGRLYYQKEGFEDTLDLLAAVEEIQFLMKADGADQEYKEIIGQLTMTKDLLLDAHKNSNYQVAELKSHFLNHE